MLYNFCAAILRAVGDTLRPLIFLAVGGFVNGGLNIFFVTVFGLDVEGVAIATVASQAVSAVGALIIMTKSTGYAQIKQRYLGIKATELKSIFIIGIPMGLSKCTFALANNIIYASINRLDADGTVMAANGVAKEFDGFILEALHGLTIATLAVISQNLGAKKMDRVKRTIFLSLALVSGVGVVMGAFLYALGPRLCSFMLGAENSTPEILEYCMVRIALVGAPYVICGIVNLVQEGIRGLGYSNTSLGLSLFSNIAFRLFWIWVIYPLFYVEGDTVRNYALICLVWPISWILVIIIGSALLIYLYNRTKNRIAKEMENLYVKS